MRPFSLLVKPCSGNCNLRCEYCFYSVRGRNPLFKSASRMSNHVLDCLVGSYMATDQAVYSFAWQGGEPLLAGVDFFKRAIDLQKTYGKPGSCVSNGVQTNGTLLSPEFARLFAQYHVLLGISLDGPPAIHDHYRRNAAGRGSHADVMKGIACCRKYGVEFNILTLVNSLHAGKGAEIYRYLCDNGFLFHQYIPCIEFNEDNSPKPYTIGAEQWGDFMCAVFDEWIKKDTRRVSVRLFDAVVAKLVEGQNVMCTLGSNCSTYFVVEHNGDVFPCDFFVRRDLLLGNVAVDSWEKLLSSPVFAEFGAQKSKWNTRCNACPYLSFCAGDCLKHRFISDANPETLSWLCAGWKQFYSHTIDRFMELAQQIQAERDGTGIGRAVC